MAKQRLCTQCERPTACGMLSDVGGLPVSHRLSSKLPELDLDIDSVLGAICAPIHCRQSLKQGAQGMDLTAPRNDSHDIARSTPHRKPRGHPQRCYALLPAVNKDAVGFFWLALCNIATFFWQMMMIRANIATVCFFFTFFALADLVVLRRKIDNIDEETYIILL